MSLTEITRRAADLRRQASEELDRLARHVAEDVRLWLIRRLAEAHVPDRVFMSWHDELPEVRNMTVMLRALEMLRVEDGLVVERQTSSWWWSRKDGWWLSGWNAPDVPAPSDGPYR